MTSSSQARTGRSSGCTRRGAGDLEGPAAYGVAVGLRPEGGDECGQGLPLVPRESPIVERAGEPGVDLVRRHAVRLVGPGSPRTAAGSAATVIASHVRFQPVGREMRLRNTLASSGGLVGCSLDATSARHATMSPHHHPRRRSDMRETRTPSPTRNGGIALAVILSAWGVTAAGPGDVADGPTYSPKGQLVRPVDYREWVFVTSGLGMTYGPAGNAATPRFDNVFVNRRAYREFLKSGTWPEGTIFILEVRGSEENVSINKGGRTQGEVVAIEAAVKDKGRFRDGGWGYFSFDGPKGPLESARPCLGRRPAIRATRPRRRPTTRSSSSTRPCSRSPNVMARSSPATRPRKALTRRARALRWVASSPAPAWCRCWRRTGRPRGRAAGASRRRGSAAGSCARGRRPGAGRAGSRRRRGAIGRLVVTWVLALPRLLP